MSIDFDDPIEPTEPQMASEGGEGGGGGNRLFIILAIGLTGLIVLGLIAIAGVVMLRRANDAQIQAQLPATATPTISVVQPSATPPPTDTPTPFIPTETPPPTPTTTPVVRPTETPNEEQAQATAVQAAIDATPTPLPVAVSDRAGGNPPNPEVPNTGMGGTEIALIAAGLLSVLFITRRLRRSA